MSPDRTTADRRVARWIAALLLVVQLLGMLHRGVVRQVTCPDHGESIHASVAIPDEGRHTDDGPSARGLESSFAAHEHCGLPPAILDVEGPGPGPRLAAGIQIAQFVLAPAHSFGHEPIDRLSLAPKQSPPLRSA